jgi:D-alanyl-D-alanine endopeptidase (penicillin-binding protein 7)
MHLLAFASFGKTLNRTLQALALVIVGAAFAAPAAHAAGGSKAKSSQSSAVSKRKVSVKSVKRRSVARAAVVPARLSHGQLAGLHGTPDELELKSSVALVVDQDTQECCSAKTIQPYYPLHRSLN